MKIKYKLMFLTLALSGVSRAVTLNLNTADSGRIQQISGSDFVATTGGTIAINDFARNNALIGDNPSDHEFIGFWTFVADAGFVADIAAGNDAALAFSGANKANSDGTPSETTVVFLGYNSVTGVTDAQADSLLEAGGASIGTFNINIGVEEAARSFTLTNAQLSGLAAGDQIYFAFDNILSVNAVADNMRASEHTSGSAFEPTNLPTLTSVPEPSGTLLSAFGLTALFLRRKRC